ncbi:MAG: cytochrome C oxidase subunit IV family protein [Candidatus Sericytochromatia bacterium]
MSTHAEHVHHETHEVHNHVPIYVKNAAILGALTAVEVAILYISLPPALALLGLYGLASLKFGLVVALFMHLKYDNKILTGIFFSGFTIALATMVALVALINYQPTKTSINVRDSKELAAMNAGDPKNGPSVFLGKGCAACHTISSVQGAVGAVGPKLDGLGQTAATRKPGMNAEAYIRESIENPTGFVVTGFPPAMPSLRSSMSDKEYKDLVAFLQSL